jgi:ornithine cyclodeaminase/alanine dehydrogenase-like protein (mu-crystallin family)
MPIFLSESDVETLLTMPDALREVENALRDFGDGRAQNRARQRVRTPHGVLHVMPAGWFTRGYVGYKAYTSFRGGARFYFHLFDGETGDYLAILAANKLGQMRTGAASGVATKFLARADAQTIGIIGTGWQAESQLEAVCAVRPISRIQCFSRNETRRKQFAEKMSARLAVRVEAVSSAEAAIRECDITIAITNAPQPVILGEWLCDGMHINGAGSNWAQRREVDTETLRRAHIILADSREQAMVEAGDLIAAVAENVIGWHQVHELAALVCGRVNGRRNAEDITFFKSCGLALEDVAVGAFVYERARAQGIGIPLAF